MAGNFKFTLPLPGKEPWETIEANYVLGKDQPLSSFDLDGRTLTLLWRKPLENRAGEKYDLAATMGIELEGEAVRFTLRIENNTPYQLGEVFFPMLGGVTGLGSKYQELKTPQFVRPSGAGAVTTSDIFYVFANRSGLGDQGPEQFYTYPKELPEPWMEFHSPKGRRFMYLGAHDPDDRSQVACEEYVAGPRRSSRGAICGVVGQERVGIGRGIRRGYVVAGMRARYGAEDDRDCQRVRETPNRRVLERPAGDSAVWPG